MKECSPVPERPKVVDGWESGDVVRSSASGEIYIVTDKFTGTTKKRRTLVRLRDGHTFVDSGWPTFNKIEAYFTVGSCPDGG